MKLETIIERICALVPRVDQKTQIINEPKRKGLPPYDPGVPTLYETQFVSELIKNWEAVYPKDFNIDTPPRIDCPYENNHHERCDLFFTSSNYKANTFYHEWAIEFKYIRLIGNNGKNNDYGITKLLSPYLKDRGLIHDADRLSRSKKAEKKAVIIYAFDYSFKRINLLRELFNGHHVFLKTLNETYRVCQKVDPKKGIYNIGPGIDIANYILRENELSVGDYIGKKFKGANRHPTGGWGRVVGWQINNLY